MGRWEGKSKADWKEKGKGRIWLKEPHIRHFSTLDAKDHTIQMRFSCLLAWERGGEGRQGGREQSCIFIHWSSPMFINGIMNE